MPNIYLSPSTQEYNNYITGNTEEFYMNRLADAMEPYLRAAGIRFTRNRPDMTAAASIRESNAGDYDLHLALHSNAAPESLSGQLRGPDIYYYPGSLRGQRAAAIIANNLRNIYPEPALVELRDTTYLGEVSKTRAPSVLIEIAYHDNLQDANWITGNIQKIARTIVLALTEYFDLPFVEPASGSRYGKVVTDQQRLNIRNRPGMAGEIIGSVPNGEVVSVYGVEPSGWMSIGYNGIIGYSDGSYIEML